MNSHWANLTVMITNLDGVDSELDDVTEIITGALRSAGYKSSVTVDDHKPYQAAPLTSKEPAAAGPGDAPAVADRTPGTAAASTVAYRRRDGRHLRCLAHAPDASLIGLDWFSLNELQVEGDASTCTECGTDVLA